MSTRRVDSPRTGKKQRTTSTVESVRPARRAKASVLSSEEEKVVRMRRGLVASDDLVLERVGQDQAHTRAVLAEIERRAFERSGRLDELRREAGVLPETVDSGKKQKIISRLIEKATPPSGRGRAEARSGAVAPKAKRR